MDYSGQKLVKCVCHVGTRNTRDLAPNCGYIEKSVNCKSNELLTDCCKRGCKEAGRHGGTWTGDTRDYQRTVLYKSHELTMLNCGPDRQHLPCGFFSCCLKARRFHDVEGMEYDTCLNRCKEGDWQLWAGIAVGAGSTPNGFLPTRCGYIGWGLVCFGVSNHYMCSHLCRQWVCVEFGKPTRERNPNPGGKDENDRPYGHGYYRYYCDQTTIFETR